MSKANRNTVGVTVCLALLALLFLAGNQALGKASEEDLAKIKVGMDQAEVQKIMGKPDRDQKVTGEEELCRLFVYKKVGSYKVVNIWFNCKEKVQAIDKAS